MVKFSQCIIAKNEEKCIKRCLESFKDIAYEQIVVDTGSTDRTVEIAKEMGAKVYHFEWCDHFSKARNHSIDLAKGDWIGIFDADEYIEPNDAKKIIKHLEAIELKSKNDVNKTIIQLNLKNIEETTNNIIAVHSSYRIFHAATKMRYKGRVHEVLLSPNEKWPVLYTIDDVFLYHTGYSKQAVIDKRKAERNLKLLMLDLEEDPQNPNTLKYIADSYMLADDKAKAYEYINLSIENRNNNMIEGLRVSAFSKKMQLMADLKKDIKEIREIYQLAAQEAPHYPDYDYAMALTLNEYNHDEAEIFDYLEKCSEKTKNYNGSAESSAIANINKWYPMMVNIAKNLKYYDKVVRYGIVLLKTTKYEIKNLIFIINMFSNLTEPRFSSKELLSVLNGIYDFSIAKDRLYVYQAAKIVNIVSIQEYIFDKMSEYEKELIKKG